NGTVSTIDVRTRTKDPTDIPVGSFPWDVAITPDGKTAFVTNQASDTVSTIDVKTGTKDPTDIPVGRGPLGVAIAPCRRCRGRSDARVPVCSCGCGVRVGGRAGGCGPGRAVGGASTGAVSADRVCRQRGQRHSLDDRCEDQT